jgi:4-aminobutyrate aminotransferase-like enzyme
VLPRYLRRGGGPGEGSYLIDVEGRRYLDLGAGIAVNTTGHAHPRVVEAIATQAAKLIHTSVVVHNERNIELAERIGALCPFFDAPQVFFCNSGAEAVDGSLKLARKVTGRPGIIAFRRAFHGRTLAATSLTTAKGRYREGYEPLLPSVYHAPYCVPHEHATPDAAVESALTELDRLLALQAPASDVGAMIGRAGAGRGRLRAPAPGLAGRPAGAVRRARHPAGVRRGPVRRRPHRPARSRPRLTACGPTSSCSPRASPRACRWVASWPPGR